MLPIELHPIEITINGNNFVLFSTKNLNVTLWSSMFFVMNETKRSCYEKPNYRTKG